MSKFNVEKGDHVLINKSASGQTVIGRIEEFLVKTAGNQFRYNIYYSPYQTKDGKQYYHGNKEILRTELAEIDDTTNIKKKVLVISNLAEYFKEKELRESKVILQNKLDYYIMRQKYNTVSHNKFPILETFCFCKKILNPDEVLLRCTYCQTYMHANCVQARTKKICVKCMKPILPDTISNLSKKRMPNQDQNPHNFKIKKTDPSNSNSQNNSNHNSQPEKEKNGSQNQFPTLSPKRAEALSHFITNLDKKNEALSKGSTSSIVEKNRKSFVDKFLYSLLYGLEELKESGEWKAYEHLGISDQMTETQGLQFCKKIAIEIETAMWLQFHEKISKEYKNKFRTLSFNLKDPRNTELRYSILCGSVQPSKLPTLDTMQLAPSQLKKDREEREQKYLKEQVLLEAGMGEGKIIAKSHKGEAIIQDDFHYAPQPNPDQLPAQNETSSNSLTEGEGEDEDEMNNWENEIEKEQSTNSTSQNAKSIKLKKQISEPPKPSMHSLPKIRKSISVIKKEKTPIEIAEEYNEEKMIEKILNRFEVNIPTIESSKQKVIQLSSGLRAKKKEDMI